MTVVATNPNPTRVTPTVSQPIRVDWGSWVEQLLAHETPMIEAAVHAGLDVAAAMVPGGTFIHMFVTDKLVDQYIEQGIKALDGVLDKQSFTIDGTNALAMYVANMFNTAVPQLAAKVGPDLDRLIAVGMAKIGVKI